MQPKEPLPLKTLIVNQLINCSEHTKALDKLLLTSLRYARLFGHDLQMKISFFKYAGFSMMEDDIKAVFFEAFLRRRKAMKVIADRLPKNIVEIEYQYSGNEIDPEKTLYVWLHKNMFERQAKTPSVKLFSLLKCALWIDDFVACDIILWLPNAEYFNKRSYSKLFWRAGGKNRLDICQWLWNRAPQEQRNSFLLGHYCEAFRSFVEKGNLEACRWLWGVANEAQRSELLTSYDYKICLLILGCGQEAIFLWLHKSATEVQRVAMSFIRNNKLAIFFEAGKLGHFEVCSSTWALAAEEERAAIFNKLTNLKYDDDALQYYYNFCQSIWDRLGSDQRNALKGAYDFLIFRQALARGDLKTCKGIYEIATSQIQARILSFIVLFDRTALYDVIRNGHLETFQWIWDLLDNYQQATIQFKRGFYEALGAGHFDLCEWLFEMFNAEQRALIIRKSRAKATGTAQDNLVHRWLFRRANQQERVFLLKEDRYGDFATAMLRGQLKKCQKIWDLVVQDRDSLVWYTRKAFAATLINGQLEIPQWLWSVASTKQRSTLMKAISKKTLYLIVERGHSKVCQWLFTILEVVIKELRLSLPVDGLDTEGNKKCEVDLHACSIYQLINRSQHTKALEKRLLSSFRYARYFRSNPQLKKEFFDYEGFVGMNGETKSRLFEAFLRRREAMRKIAVNVPSYVWEIDYQYTQDEIDPEKTLRVWLLKQLEEGEDKSIKMVESLFYCAFELGDFELFEAVWTPVNCKIIKPLLSDITEFAIIKALGRGQFNLCQWILFKTKKRDLPDDFEASGMSEIIGNIEACEWMLRHSEDVQFTEGLKFEALMNAVITGKIETCQRILELESDSQKKSALVKAKNFKLCTVALACGREAIFQFFLSSADQEQQVVIREIPQDICQIFYEAGRLQQYDMCRSLWDSASAEDKSLIMHMLTQYRDECDFYKNFSNICIAIWDRTCDAEKNNMSIAFKYLAFRQAAAQGSIENCQKFREHVIKRDQKVRMLTQDNCAAFIEAFSNGHLHVCEWIFSITNPETRASMVLVVVSNNNSICYFSRALENGHFDVCLWFWTLASREIQGRIIESLQHNQIHDDNVSYRWIFRHANNKHQQARLLQLNSYRDFSEALSQGKLKKCQYLWILAVENRLQLIEESKQAFAEALSNGHLKVCEWFWGCAASINSTSPLLSKINLGHAYRAAERGQFMLCDWVLKILKAGVRVANPAMAQHPNVLWNSRSSDDEVDLVEELDQKETITSIPKLNLGVRQE